MLVNPAEYGVLPMMSESQLNQQLLVATKKNNFEVVELLLCLGANVACIDENGWTALHWAAATNSIESARVLITNRAPLEARTLRKVEFDRGVIWPSLTPLHVAAIVGSEHVAKFLMECGADPNVCDNMNGTPYHAACFWENEGVAHVLKQATMKQNRPPPLLLYDDFAKPSSQWPGSPLSQEDTLSVLHASNVALSQSDLLALDPPASFICPISLSVMKDPVLLPETQQTYDRSSIEEWFNLGGYTCPVTRKRLERCEYVYNHALRNAIEEWKELQIKNRGFSKGAMPAMSDVSSPHSQHPSQFMSEASPTTPTPLSVFTHDSQMQQDLLLAATNNDVASVELLLNCGVALNACDSNGWTALHWAASTNAVDVVQLLVSRNAPLESKTTEKVNIDGNVWAESTALHIAAGFRSTNVARVLLDAGADPSSCDSLGGTPLHSASFWGNIDIVQALIEKGADPAAVTNSKSGSTPLHYAARQGHAAVTEVLIRSFSSKPGSLNSPYSTVEAFVNAQNSNKQTALHLAAFAGHMQVVEVLLRNGADKSMKNKSGRVPGQVICRGANNWLPSTALAEVKQHLRTLLA